MKALFCRRWGMAVLASTILGCAAGKPDIKTDNDPEIEHLTKLAGWLQDYTKEHKHGPKDLAEFEKWAKEHKSAQDGDFISTRDNQPYTLEVAKNGPEKGKAAIYEAQGDDTGMVYAVMPNGSTAGKTSQMALKTMLGGPGSIPGMPAGVMNDNRPHSTPPPAGRLPSGAPVK